MTSTPVRGYLSEPAVSDGTTLYIIQRGSWLVRACSSGTQAALEEHVLATPACFKHQLPSGCSLLRPYCWKL